MSWSRAAQLIAKSSVEVDYVWTQEPELNDIQQHSAVSLTP